MTKDEIVQVNRYYLILISVIFLVDTSDKEITLDIAFRLDLLVEDKAIIEVKSVEELKPIHHKQLLNYLKITQLKLGILVNFNEENINNGIFRKINLI